MRIIYQCTVSLSAEAQLRAESQVEVATPAAAETSTSSCSLPPHGSPTASTSGGGGVSIGGTSSVRDIPHLEGLPRRLYTYAEPHLDKPHTPISHAAQALTAAVIDQQQQQQAVPPHLHVPRARSELQLAPLGGDIGESPQPPPSTAAGAHVHAGVHYSASLAFFDEGMTARRGG